MNNPIEFEAMTDHCSFKGAVWEDDRQITFFEWNDETGWESQPQPSINGGTEEQKNVLLTAFNNDKDFIDIIIENQYEYEEAIDREGYWIAINNGDW